MGWVIKVTSCLYICHSASCNSAQHLGIIVLTTTNRHEKLHTISDFVACEQQCEDPACVYAQSD